MFNNKVKIVVPWHNQGQLNSFLAAWGILMEVAQGNTPNYLILQQDKDKSGCATTKNRGIQSAIESGAETIIILDDDCYPSEEAPKLTDLIHGHLCALEPQEVELYETVTSPPSRGTPYHHKTIKMPVAASMGFWLNIGDYDAASQLVYGPTYPMEFKRKAIFGRYFPLCGMNLAFRADSWPWCQFIDVPRFDDIWQGYLWQKKAYSMSKCFNLNGPSITHSRQSNVWANLRDEAPNLEKNESLWQRIALSHSLDYDVLRSLI